MRPPSAAFPTGVRPFSTVTTGLLGPTLLCLTLLAPAANATGEDAPLPKIHAGSLDGALAEAEERNALVLCVLLQEGEEANDRFYSDVLCAAGFQTAAAPTLLLVASDADHPQIEIEELDEDGEPVRRSVCKRYRTPNCAAHQAHSKPIFDRYKSGSGDQAVLQTPLFAVLGPDGKTLEKLEDVAELEPVLGAVAKSAKAAGPSISREERVLTKAALQEGDAALGRRAYGAAWNAFGSALEWIALGPLAERANAGRTEVQRQLDEGRDAALAQLEAGEIETGWEGLRTLSAACADSELAGPLEKVLKTARKDKRWREEIRRLENEAEARELVEEIREFLRADEERKALARVKKLVKRYSDTEAYAAFSRQHRELVQRARGD